MSIIDSNQETLSRRCEISPSIIIFCKKEVHMHILVSAATASDLAETAEQSIDYLQKVIDYVISKAHIFVSAMIILIIGWYLTRFACKIVRHSLIKQDLMPV